jgi:hypothetical protein
MHHEPVLARSFAPSSTHASFCRHLWFFRQAGQRIGISISDRDSNLIASVLNPVGTGVPNVGQRIMISGIVLSPGFQCDN